MHDERLTLATLCGGAVQERVDRALERVAKNILDPNTDPKKSRSITLKITLKPDKDDFAALSSSPWLLVRCAYDRFLQETL